MKRILPVSSLTDQWSPISFDTVANFVINDHFLRRIILFVLFSYQFSLTSLDIIAFLLPCISTASIYMTGAVTPPPKKKL